jgi:hypothetical protein
MIALRLAKDTVGSFVFGLYFNQHVLNCIKVSEEILQYNLHTNHQKNALLIGTKNIHEENKSQKPSIS